MEISLELTRGLPVGDGFDRHPVAKFVLRGLYPCPDQDFRRMASSSMMLNHPAA